MTTIKVLDNKKEIAKYTFQKGEVLRIQANKQVHYELVDDSTGRGPQNILAKRAGKDLYIILDEGNLATDIIIENYYYLDNTDEPDTENALIGLHENGRIYYYIPESGLQDDAVSMLTDNVIKPQALGGDDLVVPFWIWNPWWIAGGLLAGGLIAAAISGGGGKKNSGSAQPTPQEEKTKTEEKLPDVVKKEDKPTPQPPQKVNVEAKSPEVIKKEDNSIEITMPIEDIEEGDISTVTYTDPEGKLVTLKYRYTGGNWTPLDNAPPLTGLVLKLPNDKVKSGEPVTATTTDAVSGKTSVPNQAEKNPLPEAPSIIPNEDGSVTITLPTANVEENDQVIINFARPNGVKESISLIKTSTGWDIVGKQPEGTTFDPRSGTIRITDDAVDDNSKINAKTIDAIDSSKEFPATEKISITPKATTPSIILTENGYTIAPPADAEPGDQVKITYVDSNGISQTITLQREQNYNWTKIADTNPNRSYEIEPSTGQVILPPKDLQQGEQITATAIPEGDPSLIKQTDKSIDVPNLPPIGLDVIANGNNGDDLGKGSVTVKLPVVNLDNLETGDKVVISYLDPITTAEIIVTLTYNNGNWEADKQPTGFSLNGDTVSIDDTAVRDGENVTAYIIDKAAAKKANAQNSEEAKKATEELFKTYNESPTGRANPAVFSDSDRAKNTMPTVELSTENTSVIITAGEKLESGDQVQLKWEGPEGQAYVVVATKEVDGSYTLKDTGFSGGKDHIVVEGNKFTIRSTNIHDNSPVTATPLNRNATDGEGSGQKVSEKINDDISAPTYKAKADGILLDVPKNASHGNSLIISGNFTVNGERATALLAFKKENTGNNTVKWKLDPASVPEVLASLADNIDISDEGVKLKYENIVPEQKLTLITEGTTEFGERNEIQIGIPKLQFNTAFRGSATGSLAFNVGENTDKVVFTFQTEDTLMSPALIDDGNAYSPFDVSNLYDANGNRIVNPNYNQPTMRTVTLQREKGGVWTIVSDSYGTDDYNETSVGQYISIASDVNGDNLIGNVTNPNAIGNTIVIRPNGVMGNTPVNVKVYNTEYSEDYVFYSGSATPTPDNQGSRDDGGLFAQGTYVGPLANSYNDAKKATQFELVNDQNQGIGNTDGRTGWGSPKSFVEQVGYNSSERTFGRLFLGTKANGDKIMIKMSKIPSGKNTDGTYAWNQPSPLQYEVYKINDDGTTTELAKRILNPNAQNLKGYAYWDGTGIEGYIVISNNVTYFTPGTFKAGTELQAYVLLKADVKPYDALTADEKADISERNLIVTYMPDSNVVAGEKVYTIGGGYIPANVVQNGSGVTSGKVTAYGEETILGVKPGIIVPEDSTPKIPAERASPFMLEEREEELSSSDDKVSYSDYFGESGLVNQNAVITKLNASAGNDTLVIDVDGVSVVTSQVTSVENLDVIAKNVVINVKAQDLLVNNSEIPMHIVGDRSTLVDLGANNSNNSVVDLSDDDGVWTKEEQLVQNDITYDIYRHSSTNQTIYIQQEIEVI